MDGLCHLPPVQPGTFISTTIDLSPVVPREPQDYCAGRGGKTWFLATLVAPNGTVCAWDIQEDLRKQLKGARAKRTLGELALRILLVWMDQVIRGYVSFREGIH